MIKRNELNVGEVDANGDVKVSLTLGVQITAEKIEVAKDLIMDKVYREMIVKLSRMTLKADRATMLVNGAPPHPDAFLLRDEIRAWEKELLAECRPE